MTGWDGFAKYVGIQGVLALMMTVAVILYPVFSVQVPEVLNNAMYLAWGFYFAKNGYSIKEIGTKVLKGEG